VDTWEETPVIYLVRRNSQDATELARIEMPRDLQERFLESVGRNKGIYSIAGEVKKWLRKKLWD